MNETAEIENKELATQEKIEVNGHKLPGLAFANDGSITTASLLDMILVCLVQANNPKIDEVLKACQVQLRDLNGQLIFPRI